MILLRYTIFLMMLLNNSKILRTLQISIIMKRFWSESWMGFFCHGAWQGFMWRNRWYSKKNGSCKLSTLIWLLDNSIWIVRVSVRFNEFAKYRNKVLTKKNIIYLNKGIFYIFDLKDIYSIWKGKAYIWD